MSLALADIQPTDNPKITEITVLKEFEGMTNGEVIQALFSNADVEYWAEYSTYNINFPNDNDVKHFSFSWWNAPYKAESEDKE